jgi:hypothetical protein
MDNLKFGISSLSNNIKMFQNSFLSITKNANRRFYISNLSLIPLPLEINLVSEKQLNKQIK